MRIYGCELPPYYVPMFMPMRIFILEFIKQRLNVDHVKCVPDKKGYMFKVGKPMGCFILNSR